jgi:hypothetical protein
VLLCVAVVLIHNLAPEFQELNVPFREMYKNRWTLDNESNIYSHSISRENLKLTRIDFILILKLLLNCGHSVYFIFRFS